jgi:hypothetical protein
MAYLMDDDEAAAWLGKPKPEFLERGTPEWLANQLWHYASILDGLKKMEAGMWVASPTQSDNYIAGAKSALATIESEIAASRRI